MPRFEALIWPGQQQWDPTSVSHLAVTSLLDKQDWWHYPNAALFSFPHLFKLYSLQRIFSFTRIILAFLTKALWTPFITGSQYLTLASLTLRSASMPTFFQFVSPTPCYLVLVITVTPFIPCMRDSDLFLCKSSTIYRVNVMRALFLLSIDYILLFWMLPWTFLCISMSLTSGSHLYPGFGRTLKEQLFPISSYHASQGKWVFFIH